MPIGPALALSPAAESLESKGNLPIASSMTVKPTLQTSDLMVYAPPWMRSGAMYVDVPTNVLATELTVSVATPKSHNLIMPRELTKTLDGLISLCMIRWASYRYTNPPRMDSVILPRTSTRIGPKSFDIRSKDLEAVSIQGWRRPGLLYSPTIHILHTEHDIACFVLKRPVEGNDIRRTAVGADL
jgi:hypothetical protein